MPCDDKFISETLAKDRGDNERYENREKHDGIITSNSGDFCTLTHINHNLVTLNSELMCVVVIDWRASILHIYMYVYIVGLIKYELVIFIVFSIIICVHKHTYTNLCLHCLFANVWLVLASFSASTNAN